MSQSRVFQNCPPEPESVQPPPGTWNLPSTSGWHFPTIHECCFFFEIFSNNLIQKLQKYKDFMRCMSRRPGFNTKKIFFLDVRWGCQTKHELYSHVLISHDFQEFYPNDYHGSLEFLCRWNIKNNFLLVFRISCGCDAERANLWRENFYSCSPSF